MHVPRSELGKPTALPPDAPAVLEPGGDLLPTSFDDASPRLFPRWPVDITALDIEPVAVDEDADEDTIREAGEQALSAAVARRFIPRPYFFQAKEAYKLFGDGVRRFWWHSAHYYREFTVGTPYAFEDLETETLLALATADDRAYATMPEPMRTLINTRYLLPTGGWHQMFGKGVDIEGNAAIDNEGNVMLLQIVYDDMLHWRFGDMGAYQFWISPDDLASQNWAAVRLTFECG